MCGQLASWDQTLNTTPENSGKLQDGVRLWCYLNLKPLKQAKPREIEYNLADGNGLYLRVKPSAHALFCRI